MDIVVTDKIQAGKIQAYRLSKSESLARFSILYLSKILFLILTNFFLFSFIFSLIAAHAFELEASINSTHLSFLFSGLCFCMYATACSEGDLPVCFFTP